MKYGVLWRKSTKNIGDDMQSYAASLYLPQIDYMVDVKELDTFEVPDDEPVATIMSFWYMWHKWNWPPSKHLYPMWMGMHYSDLQRGRPDGMVCKYEYIVDGVGRDYFRMYEPIGCRDYYTQKAFEKLGISSYFSGCITLTLPRRDIPPADHDYVVVVGVETAVKKAIQNQLKGTGIEVKVIEPTRPEHSDTLTWEERKAEVIEMLETYQNAKCVITFRLHCALPSLALGTPVLLVRSSFKSPRFNPYKNWLHTAKPEQVIAGEYRDFILNPPKNPDNFKETRDQIDKNVKEFIAKAQAETLKASEIFQPPYTEQEKLEWQNKMMKESLDKYFRIVNQNTSTINKLNKTIDKLNNSFETVDPEVKGTEVVAMYNRHPKAFHTMQKLYHLFR